MATIVNVSLLLKPGWNSSVYRYGFGATNQVSSVTEWLDTPRLEMPAGSWWVFMQRRSNPAITYAKKFDVQCSGAVQQCQVDFNGAVRVSTIGGCSYTLTVRKAGTSACKQTFRSAVRVVTSTGVTGPTVTTPPVSTDATKGIIGWYTDLSLLNLEIVPKDNRRFGLKLLSTREPTDGRVQMFFVDCCWLTKAQFLNGEWERGYPVLVQVYWVDTKQQNWTWRTPDVTYAELSITGPLLVKSTGAVA